MKIEVLYVPGCQNHKPAVEAVMNVLGSESFEAEVCQVPVHSEGDARALRFPGSPTIRVNGDDVESEISLGFRPRLPALRERDRHSERSGDSRGGRSREKRGVTDVRVIERSTPLAAVAALTTLACCLPLSFLGAGVVGAVAWTGSYRVWFLGLAAVFLILGFVQIYRGHNQCKKRNHLSVALFWTSVVLVVAIVFFPQVIASLLAG